MHQDSLYWSLRNLTSSGQSSRLGTVTNLQRPQQEELFLEQAEDHQFLKEDSTP
jgi:hypothetical protein